MLAHETLADEAPLKGGPIQVGSLSDIAIGAPMAGPPAKSNGGAVYIVYGQTHPADVSTTTVLSTAGYTNDPANPATQSPLGSRYDGFMDNSHTGMALAVIPDINVGNTNAGTANAGLNDLLIGMPDADLHRPGGGGVAVLYGKRASVHINLSDLGEAGYPERPPRRLPGARQPAPRRERRERRRRHGRRRPRLRVRRAPGRSRAAAPTRARSGSSAAVQPQIDAGCSNHMLDASCPWIKINNPHRRRRATASTARLPATGSAPRSQAWATRTATASPTSRSVRRGASPGGRASAGEVVVVAGQHGSATRRPGHRAAAPAHRRRDGGRGTRRVPSPPPATSTATAMSTSSRAPPASRTSPAPPTSCAERPAPTRIWHSSPPSCSRRAPARRRAAQSPAGPRSTARGVDGLIAAPGASGAFIVNGAAYAQPAG